MADRQTLLDLPDYPADGYARLADRVAALMKTDGDLLFVQAEAVVALEAVAASVATPRLRALNIVTSPYGAWFGTWLRRGGAAVTDLVAAPGRLIAADAVQAALAADEDLNAVALVHAESASGILNPLPEIAAMARGRDALLIVDAVASLGGHAFDAAALGVDIAVSGPQKSLAGSSGLSFVSVSQRAWRLIDRADTPRLSTLSLLDLKHNWLDAGRGQMPGMPSALEFHALEAALDRVEAEGIDATVLRHERAAAATRTGLRAMGADLWVEAPQASNLVTAVVLPAHVDREALLKHPQAVAARLTAGVGPGTERLVRLNHTGQRAMPAIVEESLAGLAGALGSFGQAADLDAGLAASRALLAPSHATP